MRPTWEDYRSELPYVAPRLRTLAPRLARQNGPHFLNSTTCSNICTQRDTSDEKRHADFRLRHRPRVGNITFQNCATREVAFVVEDIAIECERPRKCDFLS